MKEEINKWEVTQLKFFFNYCMIDIVKCHEKNHVVLQLSVRLNCFTTLSFILKSNSPLVSGNSLAFLR